MNNKIIWGAVLLSLVLGVIALSKPSETVVREVIKEVKELGAFASPDITVPVTFHQNFNTAGMVATTSTASAYTLTTKELRRDISYIEWNAGLNLTLTTMASTSAPFASLAKGEGFSVDFYSATTTAATTITFAAGTGVDLQEDEGATVIINGLEVARLNFRKKNNTDVTAWLEVGQVGD